MTVAFADSTSETPADQPARLSRRRVPTQTVIQVDFNPVTVSKSRQPAHPHRKEASLPKRRRLVIANSDNPAAGSGEGAHSRQP